MTMKHMLTAAIFACLALPAYAADENTKSLKQELMQLKKDYTNKIEDLEKRLEAAELDAEAASAATKELAIEVSQQASRTATNTYNPGVGVILNGKYLSQSTSRYEFSLPGFFLGEEPGPGEPGLSLGESELNFSANVDDKFYGSMTLAFGEETEVEEAFLQTIALPAGMQVKFGRFFSAVGYLNSHHSHTDDFVYRPLAQQAFLGNNFRDDGIQLNWLAPTDLYWESGIELYRGESFPSAGASHNGNGTVTIYSHIGGDIGNSQNWRSGLSWLKANVSERQSEEGELFSGDSNLLIADFIWKWAPDGNTKITNVTIQAEYFRRNEDGNFTDLNEISQAINSDQSGWYLQGVYQFKPQWRVGMRYEQVKADELPISFDDTILDNQNHTSKQTSVMLDWSNSEYSRLRLQYSRDETSALKANLWTLQYTAAFGAHGAHSF